MLFTTFQFAKCSCIAGASFKQTGRRKISLMSMSGAFMPKILTARIRQHNTSNYAYKERSGHLRCSIRLNRLETAFEADLILRATCIHLSLIYKA